MLLFSVVVSARTPRTSAAAFARAWVVLGISVDETRNIATIGIEGDISDSEGRASLLVVSVNEMQIIADVASQVMEVA
jgi:acetate kinase